MRGGVLQQVGTPRSVYALPRNVFVAAFIGTVGLRSEAVRIAKPASARPGEVTLTGLVEHVEFQGHEILVHFDTGSRPAVVPDLEAARPAGRPDRRRRREGGHTVLDRFKERAGSLRAGPVVVLDDPAQAGPEPAAPDRRLPGDLVVRTTPDIQLRHGMQVPLLVDLAHIFVFDQHGERISPAPARLPDLDA